MPSPRPRNAPLVILSGGLLAATLDILYALTYYGLAHGVPVERNLQTIASGLLGKAAFDGGVPTALLGLGLHYGILVAAAALFYAASRRFAWLVRRAFAAGLLYGLCIYVAMNFVIVPLSAFPFDQSLPETVRQIVEEPLPVLRDLLVHLFFVGLPIALCTRAGTAGGARYR